MAKKKTTEPATEVSPHIPVGSELSRWEIQFRDETGKLPASLGLNTRIAARDWLSQHPEAKQMLAEENHRDLVALDAMLKDHGHKKRADLPAELRERLAKDVTALVWDSWDSLTEEGRREQGVWWVAQHHPALQASRQKGFDLSCKIYGIEKEIRDLDLMAASTPLERESKERQLEKLRGELKTAQADGEQVTHAGGVLAPSPAVADATGCALFRAMQNLTAGEVTITFVGDKGESGLAANNMLEISARGKTIRVALAELDLIDRRRGTLNSQGIILWGMVRKDKLTNINQNVKKMSRLRQVFRVHLGINADPFTPYRKGVGWTPYFTIYDRRGAADERAKREAEFRTDSYERLVERGVQSSDTQQEDFASEGDEADRWLKERGSHKAT